MKLYLFKYNFIGGVFCEPTTANKIIKAANIKEAVNKLRDMCDGDKLIIDSVYSEDVEDGNTKTSK